MTDKEITALVASETGAEIEDAYCSNLFNAYQLAGAPEDKGRFIVDKGHYNRRGEFLGFYSEEKMKEYIRKRCRMMKRVLERTKY